MERKEDYSRLWMEKAEGDVRWEWMKRGIEISSLYRHWPPRRPPQIVNNWISRCPPFPWRRADDNTPVFCGALILSVRLASIRGLQKKTKVKTKCNFTRVRPWRCAALWSLKRIYFFLDMSAFRAREGTIRKGRNTSPVPQKKLDVKFFIHSRWIAILSRWDPDVSVSNVSLRTFSVYGRSGEHTCRSAPVSPPTILWLKTETWRNEPLFFCSRNCGNTKQTKLFLVKSEFRICNGNSRKALYFVVLFCSRYLGNSFHCLPRDESPDLGKPTTVSFFSDHRYWHCLYGYEETVNRLTNVSLSKVTKQTVQRGAPRSLRYPS